MNIYQNNVQRDSGLKWQEGEWFDDVHVFLILVVILFVIKLKFIFNLTKRTEKKWRHE